MPVAQVTQWVLGLRDRSSSSQGSAKSDVAGMWRQVRFTNIFPQVRFGSWQLVASEDPKPWAASGLHPYVFWLSKARGERKDNNEILIFPHSSLWAFVPPLIIFSRSLCFAIYHFGKQMKGLVGLLNSCFSSKTANVVVFGFMPWNLPGGLNLKGFFPSLQRSEGAEAQSILGRGLCLPRPNVT